MLAPRTEDALADAIRGAQGALTVTGGATRGLAPAGGTPLSVAGLTGITLYEPGALTLKVRAGTPLAEVEGALAAERQRLAFEPWDARALLGTTGTPTIGGMVATNASGPRRVALGAARDFMLGVRFVDGRGDVIENGGRVMKNVTGYDLVKLLAGSHGTLGVVTEVALKVLPAPSALASVVIEGLSAAEAQGAMAAALGSPLEVTGAAHLPGDPGRTHLRLEGLPESVALRSEKLMALAQGFGPATLERDPDAVADTWAAIRDARPLAALPGDVWRISVSPSAGPGVADATGGQVFFDWGGGLLWALVPPGTDLRARLGDLQGHATLVRASAETRARLGTFQPQPAALARITQGLCARFDPRGILNPGLLEPADG